MNTVSINIERLNHLLKLYRLSKEDLLSYINTKAKRPTIGKDLFNKEVKLSDLKKIDKIFNKGLAYYVDPKQIRVSREESIFFRKEQFNAELSLGAKQIVNRFEEEKIELAALAKLSSLDITRKLQVYSIRKNPKVVAEEVRKVLYPEFHSNKKNFLVALIDKLADYNILVFEFVETWNKKQKANINGFYLTPNVIVLKRNQNFFRREIFTLIHELGHYLLNEEEIDEKIAEDNFIGNVINKVEEWCNDFAYYFLIGDLDKRITELPIANNKNNFHDSLIREISKSTHLSRISLYTRLLINGTISPASYKKVREDIMDEIRHIQERKRQERELEKLKALAEGTKLRGANPKPIISPLFIRTMQSAFHEGVINEMEFCKRLNIKPDKIEKYLQ